MLRQDTLGVWVDRVCERSDGVRSRRMFIRRRGRIPSIDIHWLAGALALSTSYTSLEKAILVVPLAVYPIPTAYQLPLASLCMSTTVSLQPFPASGDDFENQYGYACGWPAGYGALCSVSTW